MSSHEFLSGITPELAVGSRLLMVLLNMKSIYFRNRSGAGIHFLILPCNGRKDNRGCWGRKLKLILILQVSYFNLTQKKK